MWWLIVPAVGLLGKIVIDALDEPGPAASKSKVKSTLERNLVRLRSELRTAGQHRIAILGQPGAGKSSLLKKMTAGKVVPLPVIGAQTDATSWADSADCNMLSRFDHYTFVDVPGYDTATHPADVVLNEFPFGDADVYIFVVRGKLRGADEQIFRAISRSGKPVCVARSFADSLNDDERAAVTHDLHQRFGLTADQHIGFFSNRSGEGIAAIFDAVRQY
jgi:GTP-binding protein EngB required for normal cell division